MSRKNLVHRYLEDSPAVSHGFGLAIPDRRAPALRTTGEVEIERAAAAVHTALVEVAKITALIAKLEPSDPETYALMLQLRASFAQDAEAYVRSRIGRHW